MCILFKNKPSNFVYSEGRPCEESSIVDLLAKIELKTLAFSSSSTMN